MAAVLPARARWRPPCPRCGCRARRSAWSGLEAADAVGVQAAVALELGERDRGERAEDAVDPPGVEAESAETRLQLGDVVAAQVMGAR